MNEAEVFNYCSPDRRSWFGKLRDRLYPSRLVKIKRAEYEGYMAVQVEVHLDWRDLLRVLFSHRLQVDCKIVTDRPIERAETFSICYPLPPTWTQPRGDA